MPYPHTVTLIVPLSQADAANRIARAFDPDEGGQATFGGVRLSPNGAEPATHTACHTAAKESFIQQIAAIQGGQATLHQLASAAYAQRWPGETPPTAAECEAFWGAAIITADEGWGSVLDSAGLKSITTDQL